MREIVFEFRILAMFAIKASNVQTLGDVLSVLLLVA